jgi:hypothetical protein
LCSHSWSSFEEFSPRNFCFERKNFGSSLFFNKKSIQLCTDYLPLHSATKERISGEKGNGKLAACGERRIPQSVGNYGLEAVEPVEHSPQSVGNYGLEAVESVEHSPQSVGNYGLEAVEPVELRREPRPRLPLLLLPLPLCLRALLLLRRLPSRLEILFAKGRRILLLLLSLERGALYGGLVNPPSVVLPADVSRAPVHSFLVQG